MYQTPPQQNTVDDRHFTSGDVESQAVNVTPIPVAQQQSTDNDLNGIMLDIIPGVIQIQSAYNIDEVNEYSQKVIRYAIGLCVFNVLIAVLVSTSGQTNTIIDAAVSIVFSCLILIMAIKCIRSKNAICCCGISALSFYRYFLMINIFFIVIALLVSIGWISSGDLWAIIDLIYNLILFFFNCNQLRYSNKVMKALNVQIQPLNGASGGNNNRRIVSAPRTTAVPTPTTAVVQSTPSYAHAEFDTSQGQGNRDPNGYGG